MDWSQHTFVHGHIKQARRWLVSDYVFGDTNFDAVLSKEIESPLEAAFLVWFQAECAGSWASLPELNVDVITQMRVSVDGERFRLDAGFVPADPIFRIASERFGLPIRVGIEFDGHEFHERTKEQVAYRNHRDRVLQGAGWSIFHFSGSEFVRDPLIWAKPIARALVDPMTAIRTAVLNKVELA